MTLWKKFSLTRLFQSNSRPRRNAERFRPAVLALEDRTVPSGVPSGADLFADATVLSGTLVTDTGNNAGATAEQGEPAGAGTSGVVNSVWWQWTAPASGRVEVNTFGSDFDTLLGGREAARFLLQHHRDVVLHREGETVGPACSISSQRCC